MSDLTDHRRDQQGPPSARIRPGNRLRRDRSLRFSDLAVALFLLLPACAHLPPPLTGPEIPRVELWVDAFSPPGGDGSSTRPLKAIPQPVPRGAALHLRAGLYPGPFVLGEGTRLDAVGVVVLTGEAQETVVTAIGARLTGISVQGGAIGVEAGAGVVITGAHFSGQRKQAVVVHGQLTMSETELESSVEGIDGVVVDRGASLDLMKIRFVGGFKRAVTTEGGALRLRQISGEGAKTLVHAIEGKSQLEGVRSVLGSGTALFFSGGTVSLDGAELIGHEYSVQLFRGADAKLSSVKARDAGQACVTAIESTLTLSNSALTRCGPGGSVSLQNSRTVLVNVAIESAQEVGVFMKTGTLQLSGLTVRKVAAAADASFGDALHIRDEAVLTATGPTTVVDVDGSGLFASSFAQVRLPSFSVERARSSALFVERGADVTIETLLVRGGSGPAVVVPDRANVHLESLSVAGGNEMPVYAECKDGARVSLGRLESTVQQLPSQCVTRP